jgi:hypothetical protein
MVKPGILPAAEPVVVVLGVSLVHVAQTKVSAWAVGIKMTAQEARMSADIGLMKRCLNFMIKLLDLEFGVQPREPEHYL